jgi:hypothetical protein
MNGNGCAGSIASGVSTGKIDGQEVILARKFSRSLGQLVGVDQNDAPPLQHLLAQLYASGLLVGSQASPRPR